MTVTPANCVGACADEYTTTYTYDLNNRLLLEEQTEKNRTERLWYGYDANGSQTRKEREVLEKKPGHSPGKIGFVTGNEVKGKATLDTRSYNGFGQQVGVTLDTRQIRYSYRPDGMRHSKTVKGHTTLHHWDGQSIVLESNAQNRQTKAHYVRGSGLIAQVVDLSLFFYLFNAHGDVVQRVRDSGEATPTYRYDAFGNQKPRGFVTVTDLGETDPNPFRYCGEYFDAETGEVYLRARYYDTATGRFGREDPARDGNGWYNYCGGNPVGQIDSSGLKAKALPTKTKTTIRTVGVNIGTVVGVAGAVTNEPTNTYDREAAVDYAHEWACGNWLIGRNPEFYSYRNNCANFVSQSLLAGGIIMNDDWYSNRDDIGFGGSDYGIINNRMYNWDVTDPWSLAAEQFLYFSDPDNGFINGDVLSIAEPSEISTCVQENNVQIGDIIYWSDPAEGDLPYHCAIITHIDENGEIYYSANTNARYDHPLSSAIGPDDTILVIRINDTLPG